MFRLAHISDVHLGPLPPVTLRQLASKRITGYVNWHRNRVRKDLPPVIAGLESHLALLNADHTAITGDLVNLGLDSEIGHARLWLEQLGKPRDFTLVCGNHDAYVRGALEKAFAAWQPWLCGDDGGTVATGSDYPVLRRRDGISLIACNSAIATAPFLATGRFSASQGERLAALLAEEGERGHVRCVLIHHAPFPRATSRQKRLIGLGNFMEAVGKAGAELVLHGHTHYWTINRIPGPAGSSVPVCGVPAAYQWPGHRKPAAGINLFLIGRKNGKPSLRLEKHGLGEDGKVFRRIDTLDL